VDGNVLYEGDLTEGPDGFPTGLDLSVGSARISSPPPIVAACRATALTWGAPGCSGNVQAAASGASALLADITGPSTGSATFTCTDGTWVAIASNCAQPVAPPPPPAGCTATPVAWTVNGLTCQAEIEGVAEGALRLVRNTNPATRGFAQFTCTGGTQVVTSASCDPPLPPPPILTDPAQIAQAKNCIACHSVSDPAQSVGGVSFQRIADHYRGNAPAAGVLESRVKLGSVGTFGPIPMPSNPQISDAELAIVIPWILAR
jgi:cytochrome c